MQESHPRQELKSRAPKGLIYKLGFPRNQGTIIHAYVGGSALHGVKLHVTDDTDVYGVFIEKPWLALELERMEHFVTSTSPQTRKNVASDVDVTCYSLRKWASLIVKGNPTIVHSLFTPAGKGESEWSKILKHRRMFLSRTHAKKYIGYADAQLKRMQGKRGLGKHGQRPELMTKFGYDTKGAMHTLKLHYEGIELMQKHRVTLPRPAKERDLLLEVRRGGWSESRIVKHATHLFGALKELASRSSLPEHVDVGKISRFISEIYLENWSRA